MNSLQNYLINLRGKSIAKIIYRNKLSEGSLSSTAGFRKIENSFNYDKFCILDS